MELLKRFITGLAAGSLALSAVPAFAIGLQVDTDTKAEASMMLSRCKHMEDDSREECERRVRLQLEAKQDAEAGAKREDSHGELRSSMRADAQSETRVEQKERMWDRAVTMTEHLIKRIGGFAKKICKAEDTDAAVAACMERLKTSFQAKVTAAITAAFTL